MNEWMNEWLTDWMNEWMNEWMNFIQVSEYLAIKLKGDTKDDIQNEK